MREPRTPEEWQTAVDLAEFLLELQSARHYGLVTGGPSADEDRCIKILETGRHLGYRPAPDAIERYAASFARIPPD